MSIVAALASAVEPPTPGDVDHELTMLGCQTATPSWRSDEEVLPLMPIDEPTPGNAFITYSRRLKPLATVLARVMTLSEAVEDFIGCIAQELLAMLPTRARATRRAR